MKLFRHTADLPADLRGAVVALGNFDGVHRGHQAVIRTALDIASDLGAPAAVLTFEPHPRSLFQPGAGPFRLTPLRIKARLVERQRPDALFVLHFDQALAARTAPDFVDGVLVRDLGVRHVVAGYDFVFGHRRGGNIDLLRTMGDTHGFGVTEVQPVLDEGGAVFSSTRVREALAAGDPGLAAAILGHAFEIEGRVEHGDKRGRTIGFPTANVELGDYVRPKFGVYAVRAGVDQGESTVWHAGVANLGRRPTVGGQVERLEVHLFDTDQDLYGRHLRVQLRHFIREEMKFAGLDALKAQIATDAAMARTLLAGWADRQRQP